MSEETLFTAARRVVRFFNIDMRHGGLVSRETELAIETLNSQVLQKAAHDKKEPTE